MAGRRKPKLSITIDAAALEWLNANSGFGKRWQTPSHAIEDLVAGEMKREGLLQEAEGQPAPQRSKFVKPRP